MASYKKVTRDSCNEYKLQVSLAAGCRDQVICCLAVLKEIGVVCRKGLQNFTAWQEDFVHVMATYCLPCASAGGFQPALWGYAASQGAAPRGKADLLPTAWSGRSQAGE